MKKVVLFFAVAAACALTACDQPANVQPTETIDSTVTEVAEVVDSTVAAVVDSAAAAVDSAAAVVDSAAATVAEAVAE